MKSTTSRVAIACAASIAFLLSLAPARPARAEHPLAQRYLDGLFRAKPHLATFMGDHRFDGELPDLSPAALARAREGAGRAAGGADGAAASEPKLAVVDGRRHRRRDPRATASRLELLYLREIRDWEWDPRLNDSFPYYDPREIVAGRLSDIIHGDFAPEAGATQGR